MGMARMHKHLFAKRRSAAELIDRVLGRIARGTDARMESMDRRTSSTRVRRDATRPGTTCGLDGRSTLDASQALAQFRAGSPRAKRRNVRRRWSSVSYDVYCTASAQPRWIDGACSSRQSNAKMWRTFATLERQLEEAKRRENVQVILRVVGGMIKGQLIKAFARGRTMCVCTSISCEASKRRRADRSRARTHHACDADTADE